MTGINTMRSPRAALMKALGDETRLRIIDMLSGGQLCACRILEDFEITQPTLSYHMKILCESGLVDGQREGVWMKYSLNRESLNLLRAFLDNIEFRLNQSNQSQFIEYEENTLL